MLCAMQSCGMYDSSGEFLCGEPGYNLMICCGFIPTGPLFSFFVSHVHPPVVMPASAMWQIPTCQPSARMALPSTCMHLLLGLTDSDTISVLPAEIGLPAKSGVSGIVISVVPNVVGLATFSPRLDGFGNSVRRAPTPSTSRSLWAFDGTQSLVSNLVGLATFSPRLDSFGSSVRPVIQRSNCSMYQLGSAVSMLRARLHSLQSRGCSQDTPPCLGVF